MRSVAAIVVVASLLAAGCTSLTSRTRDRGSRPERGSNDQNDDRGDWWRDRPETASRPKPKSPNGGADRNTIISGTVLDGAEGRALTGVTFVQIRGADDAVPASGKGIGFQTDADGTFLMPGLTPGQTYILTAVREVDGRKIAAEMQVKPPMRDIRLELTADKVSSLTPAVPPPPSLGPFDPKGPESATIRPPEPPADEPGARPTGRENIATTPPTIPPTAAIRPPPPPAIPGVDPDLKLPADLPEARGATKVPNFVVVDVLGNEAEFRYAAGRLILLEFWSTTCSPCARAMPAIKRLHADYGQSGLEIMALACEADAPLHTRLRNVDEVARRKELNYKVYVERDGRVGEVQRAFNVQWVPTLVLLDRQGTVLWRGGATEADLTKVEDIVRRELTRR